MPGARRLDANVENVLMFPSGDPSLPRVASEMALHVLAYNLTRVMNIMGETVEDLLREFGRI